MTTAEQAPTFDNWAILELLGHVRMAGRVTEEELFGAKLGRIDMPIGDDRMVTQYFSAGSIYRLTPVSEDVARAVAARNQPEPVHRYELPRPVEPQPRPSAAPGGPDPYDEDAYDQERDEDEWDLEGRGH